MAFVKETEPLGIFLGSEFSGHCAFWFCIYEFFFITSIEEESTNIRYSTYGKLNCLNNNILFVLADVKADSKVLEMKSLPFLF